MTDTKISQLSALMQGMQEMSSIAETSKKTEAVFGAMLSQTASNGYEKQYSWTQQIGKTSDLSESNLRVYEKETAKNSFKDTSFVKESNTDITSKLPKDTKEQIETATVEIKEVLEEKLNVSEEELVQAMEELGITMLDLADPTKLTQLVMELTGSQDGSELLLNPDFQTLMSEVTELLGQLAEGLNLTPEEMQQLSEQLSKLQQNMPTEEVTEPSQPENVSMNTEVQSETGVQPETEVQDNAVLTETKETEVQSGRKVEETVVSDTAKQVEETEAETESQTLVKQAEDVTEEQSKEETNKDTSNQQKTDLPEMTAKSQTGTKESMQEQVSFQTTTQTINNGQTVEVVQTVTQTQIDVESILRQISQMTRVSVTQAQSSIEMQLNPENLGKVYLQVISKEGAITAQIAAQNEAVKEILESQIAVLKENMNQQGMKVEAIEVTVASHEFERNLEENQDNPAKEQQETEKSSRRSINLNQLDELEGLMSEEEALVAKIMQENGNSVNLTA